MKPVPVAGLRHAAYLLATGLLAVVLAFVNKYPLVYSDSGTYILSSFTLEPAADRPIGYGLIIRAVTWQSTLWTVVLFQGVVLSWLLWEVMRGLFPEDRVLWRRHLAVVAALVLLSSMPWYAAQVMPDFLTPLIVLILYLLFRAPELGRVTRGVL